MDREAKGESDALATSITEFGGWLQSSGKPAEAEALFRTLNDMAWSLATSADPARRDPALAIAITEKAVELRPEDGNIWNTLGVARYRASEYPGARADLERSAALRPDGQGANFFFLAMTHHRLGNPKAARQWYDRGVQWMDQRAPQDEQFRRFRAEAEQTLMLTPAAAATAPAPTSRPR
jgi:tetratricopeptide (TPR) repeat protein